MFTISGVERKHTPQRKIRSDKRKRKTLRLTFELDEMIKLIAFNHNLSEQKVIDSILTMVLTSDPLRYRLTSNLEKLSKQKFAYVIIRD